MSFHGEDYFNEGNDEISKRISEQIEEVIPLTMSINRILEDCSIQWKSTISKKQWKMTNCRKASYFSWQNSVVARTYFENEDLDNAFQNLLKSKSMFTNHLSHFINLLNGQTPLISGPETKNQEKMTINVPITEEINSPLISAIEDRINENIHRTFSELLKAKIYFDKTLSSLNSIENKSEKNPINIASGQKRRSKRNKIKRLNSGNRQFTSKGKNANRKDYSAGDRNETEII
ncbi:uncharacterized protein LOC127284417 isoform X2 [Leptopilina boulardi]|uniref:uncharacterized protein LOC127284417 isoform X2 n=1 Tax=Leptopilina boulardi TaxID=63433 RepID=UPI0021F5427C|nr:uncharacterized protein LOC127284417 isoform X2 [Leptopilina boulardi]